MRPNKERKMGKTAASKIRSIAVGLKVFGAVILPIVVVAAVNSNAASWATKSLAGPNGLSSQMTVGPRSLSNAASLSKRSIINVNFVDGIYDYQFINHILVGALGVAPVGNSFATGQVWNKAILDANGWPNSAIGGKSWGNHFLVPASSVYSSYVITWEGQGELQLTAGKWTASAGKNYTMQGNGHFRGTNARIQITYSGPRQQIGWRVLQTNQSGGGYFRNLRIFRAEDEGDLNAGMVFRRAYKNMLVNLDPSAIRSMNWTGGNDAQQTRFENRAVPTYATYGGSNPTISPAYTETSGTNLYSLEAVPGTPTQMLHGEIVQTRIGTGVLRAGAKTVAAITRSNPGIVTSIAHGFRTGDKIIHRISSGMGQLDYLPISISVIDDDHYSIGLDTTSFSQFVAGQAMEYISLNVGGRGEYPIVFSDGTTPASSYSNNYIRAGDYKTFFFDKTLTASKDAAGNAVYGVWLFSTSAPQNYLPYNAGVPLEICTALIRELNAMNPRSPIDMWITIPHKGLLSMDPDYALASNFAIGSVRVVLNGANGYGGLPKQNNLFVEYSNETWNWSFPQTSYLARKGYLRDPSSGSSTSYMASLRSVVMVKDIESEFGAEPRIKFVLSGQGSSGIEKGSQNYNRAFGTTQFAKDPANIWGESPISHHDVWAWAGYFLAGPKYDSLNLANLAASYAGQAGDEAAQEAICAKYVSEGVVGSGYSETIGTYRDIKLPAYASAFGAVNKATIMYEGGWDRSVTNGNAQINAFLIAVKKSQAWAFALRDFFDAFNSNKFAFMPADYVQVDQRWGHAYPDAYSGTIEGGGLDSAWFAQGSRNRMLP
jgi:hypothetical protein